jgi:glycopeptide antibiotics resistance protein
MKRYRIIYAILIFIVIICGLASRSDSPLIPSLVKEYAGDILWALAVYLSVAFLFPWYSIKKVAIVAGLFSLIIEISQLYHADWIDHIRHMKLGGLLLGYGFSWSDLICYGVGISAGFLLESCLRDNYHQHSKD